MRRHRDHLAAGDSEIDAAERLDLHRAGVVRLAHSVGFDDQLFRHASDDAPITGSAVGPKVRFCAGLPG